MACGKVNWGMFRGLIMNAQLIVLMIFILVGCVPEGANQKGKKKDESALSFNGAGGLKGNGLGTKDTPQDTEKTNGWGKWGEWSECDKKCGEGHQRRTRVCETPSQPILCQGDTEEVVVCFGKQCGVEDTSDDDVIIVTDNPVDGYWHDWEEFSACTKTCGGGTKTRTRTCSPPKNGGNDCEGSSTETVACNTHNCPIDGVWSEWSVFSDCSKSCGGGLQSRTRTCTPPLYGGKDCEGSTIETVSCNTQVCDSDGVWSAFSEWSGCSKTCGGGTQSRSRTCDGQAGDGADCVGDATETRSCNEEACPIDGVWSGWTVVSECSQQCGGGVLVRTRTCTPPQNGGKDCIGEATETVSCNDDPCPVDGVWGEWSPLSTCSVACGPGFKTRTRICDGPYFGGEPCDGVGMESYACEGTNCSIDGYWLPWGSWSDCSQSCGGGLKSRTRQCHQPENGGEPCVGSSYETASCNTQACEGEESEEELPVPDGYYACNEQDKLPYQATFRTNYQNYYYIMNPHAMNVIESTAHRDCSYTLGVVIPGIGVMNFISGKYRLNNFTRIAEECADYDGVVKIDSYATPLLLYGSFYIDTNIWGTNIYAWKEGKAQIRRCKSAYKIKKDGLWPPEWIPINTWDQFEVTVSCTPRFCQE